MEAMKLSIIVPVYNTEKYLSRCLDSLVHQTMKDIEIICVNDGSKDNSIDILKDYASKYKNIVIIDKPNEGVWKARIDGIQIAKGDYIGFLDSDDYVHLDFAEKLYTTITKKGADICVCGFERIDMDTNNVYSKEMCKPNHYQINIDKDPGALLEINGAMWNKVYRKDLFNDLYTMKQIPKISEDMMFQQLVFIHAKTICFIDESLIYYMVHADSTMSSANRTQLTPTHKAMKEVRDYYEKVKPERLDYIDANALLHLGISLIYHFDQEKDFRAIVNKNTKLLNQNFPRWRHTKYTTLRYVITHHGTNAKLWIIKIIYNLHLIVPFIKFYNWMIKTLKIDIKW